MTKKSGNLIKVDNGSLWGTPAEIITGETEGMRMALLPGIVGGQGGRMRGRVTQHHILWGGWPDIMPVTSHHVKDLQ